MANGYSLHIGLNAVDPNAYGGWSGTLNACEQDALDMHDIAQTLGYRTSKLLTESATSSNTIAEIEKVAKKVKAGDIFVLTYSGHGGQIPDTTGEETDGLDETWVLYDRQLIDDELYSLFSKFKPGVRIFMLSDSCHSGTVARALFEAQGSRKDLVPIDRFKAIPYEVSLKNFKDNRTTYLGLKRACSISRSDEVGSAGILISGCQDWQTSMDGPTNGAFTGQLLRVWNEGEFVGNYSDFYKAIVDGMKPSQTPNYYLFGASSPAFESSRPFSILTDQSKQASIPRPCSMTLLLDIGPNEIASTTWQDIETKLNDLGIQALEVAYRRAKESLESRSGEADLGCSVHDGHWECHGGVHIRF